MFDKIMENLTISTQPHDAEDTTIGVLCMGGPGSGKTRFSSTADGPILVLDFDHGLTTYVSEGLVAGKDYFPYTFEKFDFTEVQKPTGTVKRMKPRANIDEIVQILAWAADKDGPFAEDGIMKDVKTIVVDGFTSMSDYFLYEIMVDRLKLNYDKDKPGFEGYGQLQRALGNVAELLIKCKKHYNIIGTVLVKWEQRPGSNADGDVIANPQIDGSFRNQIGKVLDEFYYFDSKQVGLNTQYLVNTQPTRTVPNLKTRSKVSSKIDDPSFQKIKEALVASHKERGRK